MPKIKEKSYRTQASITVMNYRTFGTYIINDQAKNSLDQYTEYVINHAKNVCEAFDEYEDIFNRYCTYNKYELAYNLCEHDLSKLGKDEMMPSALKWFPPEGFTASKESGDIAWLHHIHSNKHHPEYWVLRDDDPDEGDSETTIFIMPDEYVIEMICDWLAMSKQNNNSIWDWYADKGCKKSMHEHTREVIETIIRDIKERDS